MFCPKCGCEYRDGFKKCSDCEVTLVDGEPTKISLSDNDKEYIKAKSIYHIIIIVVGIVFLMLIVAMAYLGAYYFHVTGKFK